MWTNFNHYNPNIFPMGRMCKRKMPIYEFDEPKPAKILVSEEVMANQLNGLHLSNSYTSHGTELSTEAATPSTSGTSETLFNADVLPKLTICDELRALNDSLTILPKVLEPERPTSALILWQPPAGDLGKYLQLQMDKQKDKESEEKPETKPGSSKDVDDSSDRPPASPQVASNMDVELENNNTEMSCAYSSFSRAI